MARAFGAAGGSRPTGVVMTAKSDSGLDGSTGGDSTQWGPGAKLGLIGGGGEMGRLFGGLFRDFGYHVEVSDAASEGDNAALVEASDIVVFAVPLHETESVIAGLMDHTRPDQLIMDLSSLKTGPVREMLKSRGSVVGLHPMFGGRTPSFQGQTLVACPVRIDPGPWAILRGLFSGKGMKVKETSPEEHDKMMSIIQVLFHMTTMLTGRVLRELGVDIAETMEYTSPSYRLEMNILGRILAQNGSLYSAITLMNPNTGELIDHLVQGLECYRQWCGEKNLDAFVEDFGKSAEHLGSFCARAYRESSVLLDLTVRMAAGQA